MDTSSYAPVPRIQNEDIQTMEFIGAGSYGTVRKGKWISQNKLIAIKRLPTINPNEREIEVLTFLRHKNIILFYGIVVDAAGYGIVTEFAEHGSLWDYLRSKHAERLNNEIVLSWALNIAEGMEYLHFTAPQSVIHRDLKSKNVVISTDMVCKLCDFGSSKFHENTIKQSSILAGTMAWMAPEVIKESIVSISSDTYSFGIVLWELLTCKAPYDDMENLQVAWVVTMKGERPHIPNECPKEFKVLIQSCWKEDPSSRPNFKCIVKIIESLKSNESLGERTGVFLEHRESWLAEIKEQNLNLQKLTGELSDKEKELMIYERQLMIKEKQLRMREKRKYSTDGYHAVEKWTPHQVYQWLRSIESEDDEGLCYLEVANKFFNESIGGKSLLRLNDKDLIKMDISSLGTRSDILNFIGELKHSNNQMIHFPPLAPTNESNSVPSLFPQTLVKEVKLILIFGKLKRANADIPNENKWKLYLELDGDESAIPSVKLVKFTIGDNTTITIESPPFITNKWITAKGLGHVQCHIEFDEMIVISPEYQLLLFPEGPDLMYESELCLKVRCHSKELPHTPSHTKPEESSFYKSPSIASLNTTNSFNSSFSSFDQSSTDISPEKSEIVPITYTGQPLLGTWTNPGKIAKTLASQTRQTTIVLSNDSPFTNNWNFMVSNAPSRPTSSLSIHSTPGDLSIRTVKTNGSSSPSYQIHRKVSNPPEHTKLYTSKSPTYNRNTTPFSSNFTLGKSRSNYGFNQNSNKDGSPRGKQQNQDTSRSRTSIPNIYPTSSSYRVSSNIRNNYSYNDKGYQSLAPKPIKETPKQTTKEVERNTAPQPGWTVVAHKVKSRKNAY